MELSFRWKILLELVLAALAVLTVLYPYLGILVAVIAIILIVNEIGARNSEKANFRNSAFEELKAILDALRGVVVIPSIIACPIWKSKTDHEKIELVGADDFSTLELFYKEVENLDALNMGVGRDASKVIQDALNGTSRGNLIILARRLFDEIIWLRSRRGEVAWLLG